MTRKQKLAAKKVLESPLTPISVVMKEVGYSDKTAINPSKLTKSKAWMEYMEEKLPDEVILNVHREALSATKQLSVRGGKDANAESDDFIEVPDHSVRLKAVELAYKIKHKDVFDNPSSQTLIIQRFRDHAEKERKKYE